MLVDHTISEVSQSQYSPKPGLTSRSKEAELKRICMDYSDCNTTAMGAGGRLLLGNYKGGLQTWLAGLLFFEQISL